MSTTKQEQQINYLNLLSDYLVVNEFSEIESSVLTILYESIHCAYLEKLLAFGIDPEGLKKYVVNKGGVTNTFRDDLDEHLFYLNVLLFIEHSESIIAMVVKAALKRKTAGIPALQEQDEQEQLQHCSDHLLLWSKGQVGDEKTVTDQAKHTACRTLLAYFTRQTTIDENEE